MKLIVAGAKGFVATEVIRQSLSNSHITSVIALARGSVAVPKKLYPSADTSKFHSVSIKDYGSYSDEIKKHFADADACIWTVAITPTKSKSVPFEEVRRVCNEVAVAGLTAMIEARKSSSGASTPFRFMFMSGIAAERDQSKKPGWMPEYSLMRGEGETQLLSFAAKSENNVEVCVAKPGIIIAAGEYFKYVFATILGWLGVVPSVYLTDIAAAMLEQVLTGFEKEPLLNNDLVRIGQQVLKSSK